jgi:hypothetical protein
LNRSSRILNKKKEKKKKKRWKNLEYELPWQGGGFLFYALYTRGGSALIFDAKNK